jgi:oxalate decarboxylase/phosphoglucose isomerase-like protein (cupin superfamily)
MVELISRKRLMDQRGSFLKVLTGAEEGLPAHIGEFYVTRALPGAPRGNHYHPKAAEWFTLIEGVAELVVKDPTTLEERTWTLHGDDPVTVYMPPGLGHVFVNTGDDPGGQFTLLAYSADRYDPLDTVPFEIRSGSSS